MIVKHFRFLIIIIIVLLLIIIFSVKRIHYKRQEPFKYDNVPPNFSDQLIPIRRLYRKQFGNMIPRGGSTTFAIISDWNAVWSATDVEQAWSQNGITYKDSQDIMNQVSSVNATTIGDEPFNYLGAKQLSIPLSDGFRLQMDPSKLLLPSFSLSAQIQTILGAMPDARIIIFYIGIHPDVSPPGTPIPKDAYNDMIQKLIDALLFFKNDYHILCLTKVFNSPSNLYDLLKTLTDNDENPIKVTCMMPNVTSDKCLYPAGFTNILNVGGYGYTDDSKPSAYDLSGGGYLTCQPGYYDESLLPPYQIGVVPDSDIDKPQIIKTYVGCPDLSGNIRNLGVNIMNSVYRFESTILSPVAYGCAIAIAQELSNYRRWDFQDIFYRYSNFLFESVHVGGNGKYDCQNYNHWNPCAGLGTLDGQALSLLLQERFIKSGNPMQLSFLNISREMSYINFFPVSPLEDPLNILPQHDRYNTLPTLGPQCLWSRLRLYSVNLVSSGNYRVDYRDGFPIYNGSIIVIAYEPNNESNNDDVIYLLECFDRLTARIHSCSKNNFVNDQIDNRYLWKITQAGKPIFTTPEEINLFADCRISPMLYSDMVLTSEYSTEGSIFSTAPSLQPIGTTKNDVIRVCPHYESIYKSYPGIEYDPIEEDSYFVNLTNYNEFWACGVEYNNELGIITSRGSIRDSDSPWPIFCQRSFDPVPQWLLIPLPSQQNMEGQLKYGRYMIFNTRMRAYATVRNDQQTSQPRVFLMNINSASAPIYTDVYNNSIFHINRLSSNNDESEFMFTNHPIYGSPLRINSFLCPVVIDFKSSYFTKTNQNIKNNNYFSFFISESSKSDAIFKESKTLYLVPAESNYTRAQTFCFHVHPKYMVSDGSDINMILPNTTYNSASSVSRFINHGVSSFNSNSYVQMIPLNNEDLIDNLAWFANLKNSRNMMPFINDSSIRIPILSFDSNNSSATEILLRNVKYPDQYLISYEGGWKPRLGYALQTSESGLTWSFIPNYQNIPPSYFNDNISLAGNYFYKTLYYINCPKGIITCALNVPHQPALLTEITNENINTVYYSSLFMIV